MFDSVATLAPTSSTVPTSVGVAIVSAYVLDYAKRFEKLPQVTYYSNKLNSWLRLALAGIGTFGVSYVWSAVGTGHQLILNIPAWSVLGSGLWHWAIQYGTQHFSEIILAQRPVAKQAAQEQAAKVGA